MKRTWPVALVIGLAACGGPSGDGSDLDRLPELSVEEDLRIGSVEDPEVGFSQITAIDVDREGHLYVFEGSEQQIRVYDGDGTLIRRIGHKGQGPGEFQRASRFGVVGDTVWTFDYGTGDRITLFDREGTLLSTGRAEAVGIPLWNRCFGYVMPWAMRPDGLFTSLFGRWGCNPNAEDTGVRPGDSIPVPRLLFAPSGEIVDTIGWDGGLPPRMAPPGQVTENRTTVVQVEGRSYVVPQPPSGLDRWLRLHDGRIELSAPVPTTDEGVLTIRRIGLRGDTVFSRSLRYEARRYSSESLDALAASAVENNPFGGGSPPAIAERQVRAAMAFPELRPIIGDGSASNTGRIDEDGRLWIFRDDVLEGTRWILLDEQARPVAQLGLPTTSRLLWSRGDVLWVVETDQLDVPWLVRYRFRTPA